MKVALSINKQDGGGKCSSCHQEAKGLFLIGGAITANKICYKCLPAEYKDIVNSPFGQILYGDKETP
jgi:hypothetical protein